MLVMDLTVPAIVVVFGLRFPKAPPREINAVYSCRAARSMKNRDTWAFAHQHIGKLRRTLGLVLLPLSAPVMLRVWGKDVTTVSLFGGVVCAVQVVVLLCSLFPPSRP